MKIRGQKSLVLCSSLLSMLCIVEYRSMILSGQPRGEGVQKGLIAGAGHDAGHFLEPRAVEAGGCADSLERGNWIETTHE
ncbi:hypothetical protein [Paraburkholderia sp.]|uniref:hypothetical protein n=1 Tax=Paraburkholderia sp. TaxID=1926495 RepID=UPI002D5DCF25|nr:hypothetical protein [Paraburkholderia sp.]HZZ04415.1 hypothetical protein [Paraburkholderia sp.]